MTQINKPNFGYTNGINNAAGVRKSDFGSKVAPRDKVGETTVKDVSVVQEMLTNEQIQSKINQAVNYANNSGSNFNLYELRSMMNGIMYYASNYSEKLSENAGNLDISISFEFGGKTYSIECTYKGDVRNPYPVMPNNDVIPGEDNEQELINTNGSEFDNQNVPKRVANQTYTNGSVTVTDGIYGGSDNPSSDQENPISVKINQLLSGCNNGYKTLGDVREILDYLVSQDSIDSYSMSIENGKATILFKYGPEEFKLEFNQDGTPNGTSRSVY